MIYRYFSQCVGHLFILFMVSFAVKKLISLIRSHLFIFVLISISLGDLPNNTLVYADDVILYFLLYIKNPKDST